MARAAPLRRLGRTALRKPLGTVSVVVLVALWLVVLFAPVIAPFRADAVFVGPRLAKPSGDHWLGTDEVGRDVFSRVVYGSRLSLSVSVGSTALGIAVGT